MAKDNRKILRTPRVGNRKITDEDELASLLTPEQGKKLIEAGALSGDWEFTGSEEEVSTAKEEMVPVSVAQAELDKQSQVFNASWATLTQERDELLAKVEKLTKDLKAAKAKPTPAS